MTIEWWPTPRDGELVPGSVQLGDEPPPPIGYRRLVEGASMCTQLLRKVIELHRPHPGFVGRNNTGPWWECGGCDPGAYAEDSPVWTTLIADHLEVNLDGP